MASGSATAKKVGPILARAIGLLFFCLQPVRGHVVEQFYLSLEEKAPEWRIEVTFDAAYAYARLRDDQEAPQPQRAWLLALSEEEHQELRVGAEAYLREAISLWHGGDEVSFEISFSDYETSPPSFPTLLNGGAYVTVEISGSLEDGKGGGLELSVSRSVTPKFIVASTSGESFLVIAPGEQKELFATKTGSSGLFWLGYLHVLPDGMDHTLFILALFLMARRWRPLVSQSLVFTVAHSVSLGLAVAGVIPTVGWAGASLIEPLIALSIVVLALENVFSKGVKKVRLLVVFGFGLIHGLGFAGSLGVVVAQGDRFLGSLFLANLGVETAQVTVLAIAWLVTLGWWRFPVYEKARIGLSLVIAAVGLWWTVERLIS